MGPDPRCREHDRRPARGGRRRHWGDDLRPSGGRGLQPAQSARALHRHHRVVERCGRRGERARAPVLAAPASGQSAGAGEAHDRLQRRRCRGRGRRHRDQSGQHGRQPPLSHDQRGRHHREPARDGREGPRRVDLALRPHAWSGARHGRRPQLGRAGCGGLDPPGRDAIAVGPGIWETSGIIDATALFGADTWVSDVQAHPPTTPPVGPTTTVEDGQLFLMSPD